MLFTLSRSLREHWPAVKWDRYVSGSNYFRRESNGAIRFARRNPDGAEQSGRVGCGREQRCVARFARITHSARARARALGISPNIFLLGQTLPPSLARSLARGESLETESVPVVPLLLAEGKGKGVVEWEK